jgi:large subunit ribosomal protein L5
MAKEKKQEQQTKQKEQPKGKDQPKGKEQTKGKEQPKKTKGKEKVDKVDLKPEEKIPARLYEKYKTEIIPGLVKFFNYKSVMQTPKLEKIIINMGVGQATQDAKILEDAVKEMEIISGQKPLVIKAKKSVSNFKLREGVPIGCKVTLRKDRMYEFLDRLINIAIPRIRDFRGLSDKSFDGRGSYTFGVKEHIIFPEVNVDKIIRLFGMDITVVTSAKTDSEAYELLKGFGMPFRKKETT